jgi:hypothetical protein
VQAIKRPCQKKAKGKKVLRIGQADAGKREGMEQPSIPGRRSGEQGTTNSRWIALEELTMPVH